MGSHESRVGLATTSGSFVSSSSGAAVAGDA